MSTLSKMSTAVLVATAGACFATSIAIVYLLLRKPDEEILEKIETFKTSRHTVIEIEVPEDIVGSVIGRSGANLHRIQEATGVKINFKDPVEGVPFRLALIRGKPDDAQKAERLLRSAIAERLSVSTKIINIPTKACGFVIGKGGISIREIKEISKAKITIEQPSQRNLENHQVFIRGTAKEIELAEMLIEEKVASAMCNRSKGASVDTGQQLSVAKRQVTYQNVGKRLLSLNDCSPGKMKSKFQVEELVPTSADGFLDVFVSAVESPSRFWVQPIGVKATELDKLIENMTELYGDKTTSQEYKLQEVRVDDFVAAPFSHDDSWYRAVVFDVSENDYDPTDSIVQVYYTDFGDHAKIRLGSLRGLREDFRRPPFQAIQCLLAGISPVSSCLSSDMVDDHRIGRLSVPQWPIEATKTLNELLYCAQWKPVMLRVLGEDDKLKYSYDVLNLTMLVEIVDADKDGQVTNVAQEMVRKGLAKVTTNDDDDSTNSNPEA